MIEELIFMIWFSLCGLGLAIIFFALYEVMKGEGKSK